MKKQEKWIASFQQASDMISQWRQTHPRATFTDIENTVDEQLAQLRASMIQDLVEESRLVDIKRLAVAERPRCPGCGRALAANGRQTRQLTTRHDQVVEVERSKGYCRHCHVSFFSPG